MEVTVAAAARLGRIGAATPRGFVDEPGPDAARSRRAVWATSSAYGRGASHGVYRGEGMKLTTLAVVVMTAGCVRTVDLGTVEVGHDMRQDAVVRSAQNLPVRFSIVAPATVSGDCPARLQDDWLGTSLHLSRSVMLPVQDSAVGSRLQSFGDYSVTPRGHYGDTEPDDGLRIDCTRLRAVGIVTILAPRR
jgi:hypothetical protein